MYKYRYMERYSVRIESYVNFAHWLSIVVNAVVKCIPR